MKKSELKKYVRENIISELSESTEDEIAKTKELTQAVQDLESAKKEAGIEEDATPKGEDFTYDYEDIGQFYLEGFGKDHTLTQDQLGKLGKTITKRFYGGDIKKAYDDVYKTSQNAAAKRLADRGQLQNPRYTDGTSIKEEIPTATMSKINSTVTTIPSAAKQMLDFFNQMAEKETLNFMKNSKFKIAIDKLTDLAGDKEEAPVTEDLKEVENVGLADLYEMGYDAGEQAFEEVKGMFKNKPDFQSYKKGYMQGFIDNAGSYGLSETVTEEEDKEPSKSDIKKTKGLAKAKEELALLTREMKSLAKKYSKAEGADKEKLVKILKDKTKLKKELESILDKKKI
jgi:hypothetical protein